MSVQIVKLLDPMSIVNIPGGLVPKGAYNNGTAYSVGDSVSYNGSSYVCITASTGNLPTDTAYWQLVASKGNTGATGPQGPAGTTDYNELDNLPTLGTAAAKDIPATGNASATEVVYGTDTRLTDSRPASDVSAWAKAPSKPTYNNTEVGAAATAHTHAISDTTGLQTALNAKANASDTVNLTGNQTIAGVKTFSSSPVVPTATTSTQAVNKSQMDTADALKVNKAGDTMTGTLDVTNSFGSQSVVLSGTSPDRPLQVTSTHAGQVRAFINNLNTSGDAQFTVASNGATKWSAGFEATSGDFVVANGYDLDSSRIFSVKADKRMAINGADYITGTGFPEGVISAPVGSIYIDKAITNGASSWIKKSGTGNTGWQVLEGDTGWRNMGKIWGAISENILLRRVGQNIYITTDADGLTISSLVTNIQYTCPPGFRPSGRSELLITNQGVVTGRVLAKVAAGALFLTTNTTGTFNAFANNTFLANDNWPSTLPGTAV